VKTRLLFALGVAICLGPLPQIRAQSSLTDGASGRAPLFVVHTTTRAVQAVNYQHHGGATKIDFAGNRLFQPLDSFSHMVHFVQTIQKCGFLRRLRVMNLLDPLPVTLRPCLHSQWGTTSSA